MSVDFNVEELMRGILNPSEARAQPETKAHVRANPVITMIKTRQTMKTRPPSFIRMHSWRDETDWSKDHEENDRQSEEKPVPRRRARRIKMNWGPDEDKGEDGENDALGVHGPIITTLSVKGRRLHMK